MTESVLNKIRDVGIKVTQKLEEPLFAVAVLASLLGFVAPLLSKTFFQMISLLLFLLCVASVWFIYIIHKATSQWKDKFNHSIILIPVLIFAVAFSFLHMSEQSNSFRLRDMVAVTLLLSVFLFFIASYLHRMLSLNVALISAIFFSTLILHLAPAVQVEDLDWTGRYISNIDPYFFYRHGEYILTNGHVPENETLSYPTDPPTFGRNKFMVSVFMGSLASLLQPFGFSFHDVAMLYAGVFAALCVLVLYLLVTELFYEMQPYNLAAAVLSAFMLMLSSPFSISAIATNCEDDTLGMFLFISSFMLFALAYRKRSYIFALLSGFSLLMLNVSWGGYSYAVAVLGIFSFFYAFFCFIHKSNCVRHIPYFIIAVGLSLLEPLVLHPRGQMPVFSNPGTLLIVSVAAPLFVSVILEAIRASFWGEIKAEGRSIESVVENFIEENIMLVAVLALFSTLLFSFFISPTSLINFVVNNIKWVKQQDIIGMTTAEQVEVCRDFDVFSLGTYGSCISTLSDSFGFALILGLLMIPVLLWFSSSRTEGIGPAFVLAWSLPMLWGVINKSQYMFTASVPIVVLGGSVGLILALNKKDFESLRVIPTTLLVVAPIYLYFIQGGVPVLEPFGGVSVMYHGLPGDVVYWYPTLEWLKTLPENATILTWWDYGHWITAVSHRVSIADNTKAKQFIVQDLAKFHVLIEDETEALSIAKKYNATHVIIDYTMIGKSAAPHFIATSNLTAPYDDPNREGEHMGYSSCSFSPGSSRIEAQYVQDSEGNFIKKRTLVFICNIAGDYTEYVGALIFDIIDDSRFELKVRPIVKKNNQLDLGREISWEIWRREHKASILGVFSPITILSNALTYKENPQNYINFPTYTTFVYVPEKFNKYMMTSLYLGDYMEDYKRFGLCDSSVQRLKHFSLVDGFVGLPEEYMSGRDISHLGYVRAYAINYSVS